MKETKKKHKITFYTFHEYRESICHSEAHPGGPQAISLRTILVLTYAKYI